MLELTATTLKGMEDVAGAGLAEAQAHAEKLRTDATVAGANYEAAKTVAEAKLAESNAKEQEVQKIRSEVEAAKTTVQSAVQKKEDFLAGRAKLTADEEAFNVLLEEAWEPLKASKYSGGQWRKRDKVCADLLDKLGLIALDGSLLDALDVALKMKLDQRTHFAQTAISCAEDCFAKHKALLTERIAATGAEEAECDKAVAEAEAKFSEVQGRLTAEDKEYDELQNSWAELESQSKEAKDAAAALDNDVEAALSETESRKSELDAAVGVSAAFAAMLTEEPKTEHTQPEPAAEVVADIPPAAVAMELEPAAVAAC